MTGVAPDALAERLRRTREAVDVSEVDAATAIGLPRAAYAQIEAGTRPLRADELVMLADRFAVRAGTIVGRPDLERRAHLSMTGAAVEDPGSPGHAMRARLAAYLELDAYLTDQGIPAV